MLKNLHVTSHSLTLGVVSDETYLHISPYLQSTDAAAIRNQDLPKLDIKVTVAAIDGARYFGLQTV